MKAELFEISMRFVMWGMTMAAAYALGRSKGYYDCMRDKVKP